MLNPIGIRSRISRPSTAQAQNDRHQNPRLKGHAEAQRPHVQVRVSQLPSPRVGDRLRIPSVSLGPDLGKSLSIAEIKDAGKYFSSSMMLSC